MPFPLCAQIFEFLVQTPIFKEIRRAIYIDERSTRRSLARRVLAIYWLKKSFLSKVKGMNDHGIRRTFPLYALILPKYEIKKVVDERSTLTSDLHVDRLQGGFLTFTVGKTQFRGLCLSPLGRALSELSKYAIKKGGHFILRQSL